MKATNLNYLFIDLLPSYGFIVQSTTPISKEDFMNEVKKVYDINQPRHSLFFQSIQKSDFETIRLNNTRDSILFNH